MNHLADHSFFSRHRLGDGLALTKSDMLHEKAMRDGSRRLLWAIERARASNKAA